jgi:hypothetical protein
MMELVAMTSTENGELVDDLIGRTEYASSKFLRVII